MAFWFKHCSTTGLIPAVWHLSSEEISQHNPINISCMSVLVKEMISMLQQWIQLFLHIHTVFRDGNTTVCRPLGYDQWEGGQREAGSEKKNLCIHIFVSGCCVAKQLLPLTRLLITLILISSVRKHTGDIWIYMHNTTITHSLSPDHSDIRVWALVLIPPIHGFIVCHLHVKGQHARGGISYLIRWLLLIEGPSFHAVMYSTECQ